MCLVLPLRVIKIMVDPTLLRLRRAKMEDGRIIRSLVKNTKVGDYLICQQDLGIEKVPASKAKLIRNALQKGI
jgi:hydrogenase maturation factor